MSKVKFKRNTLSAREMRRMGERERTREQRQQAIDAFWALPPEERAKRMADEEAFRRIQRNGITVEDLAQAEDEAYVKGVAAGKDATVRTCFAAICMSLHEMHGFDKEQCSAVLNDVYDRLTFTLTSEEAIQEVYDTIGLTISFKGDVTDEAVTVNE